MAKLSIHHCTCRRCRSGKQHPDRAYHHHINVLMSRLSEPQRRWFAAVEALHIGHGGKRLLARITGMSPTTILRGCVELESDLTQAPEVHLRAAGGGRPAAEDQDPGLEAALLKLLESETAGDPMGRRAKAKRSSLRHLSQALTAQGHPTSRMTVAKLLHKSEFSPKANARRTEARGASPKERNEQFEHISEQRTQFKATGDPIISVDTKKKK
nr:hypothetical protein [Noviherbaspirillum sp. Root189]